jgi:hypothetical protein
MSGNSLKSAISAKLALQDEEDAPQKAQAVAAAAKPKSKGPGARKSNRGPGSVLIGAHFPSSVRDQLRLIAIEEGRTSQELVSEALDLLFAKKGKAQIAKLIR